MRQLKCSKCMEQKQAVQINHDIFIKMIDAQPDALAGTRNRALLSLGYGFLARRSKLDAIRSNDLKFTPDGAFKEMIKKVKPINTGGVGWCSASRGVLS
jgi:integrase/recombinase XerD